MLLRIQIHHKTICVGYTIWKIRLEYKYIQLLEIKIHEIEK